LRGKWWKQSNAAGLLKLITDRDGRHGCHAGRQIAVSSSQRYGNACDEAIYLSMALSRCSVSLLCLVALSRCFVSLLCLVALSLSLFLSLVRALPFSLSASNCLCVSVSPMRFSPCLCHCLCLSVLLALRPPRAFGGTKSSSQFGIL